MDAVKLGFGEHYSDGSGWEWLVELDTEKDGDAVIRFDLGTVTGSFRPEEVNPRLVALAFNRIADVLGYDLLDEQIAEARDIVGEPPA